MARRGKYPSPFEAATRYITGVELSRDKWVQRAREGMTQYQAWFTGFANTVYPVIAGLPPKTGNVDVDIDNRVKPVARAIKSLAMSYRVTKIQTKLRAIAPLVAPAPTAGAPAPR